jgi:hypothetical protein
MAVRAITRNNNRFILANSVGISGCRSKGLIAVSSDLEAGVPVE